MFECAAVYLPGRTPTLACTVVMQFGGHHIRVDRAAPASAKGSVAFDHLRTLFVGNLPHDCEVRLCAAYGFVPIRTSLRGWATCAPCLWAACTRLRGAPILWPQRVHCAGRCCSELGVRAAKHLSLTASSASFFRTRS